MYNSEMKVPSNLPKPQGYRILVAVPDVAEKTKGGILLPDELKALEKTASIFGFVVAMGPDCYKDKEKFPSGPWCQKGDFVLFRSYSGTRFKIEGQEFRIINDDTVEAIAEDPSIIARA